MSTGSEQFRVVHTPEEAVDQLAALYDQAVQALSEALRGYLRDRTRPSASQLALFHYPELRLVWDGDDPAPSSVRAWARLQVPGTYAATITHPQAFRGYLLEQLGPLTRDFKVRLEVGVSQQAIPYPYVVEQGDELAGSGVTAAELARVFPSTDLSATSDGVADGLLDWASSDPLPLALFDAARVDFSLRRLVHYTGTDWRHVQPWILLTNYHRYVDQFIRHGLDMLLAQSRFCRLVLPGNVVVERGMPEGEMQAVLDSVVWHKYQMPAYHLEAADG
ncbi:MAG: AMP nucleosidase, partial [Pseudomonadaceae bacterium]|nr:AMP nucleosidase [Pseudomonadaceae bacterium]